MTEPDAFHHQLSKDPAAQMRWDAIVASTIALAKSEGAIITPSDVEKIPSAKLTFWGHGELKGELFERELAQLPAIQKAREDREIAEAVAAGDSDAQETLAAMRPAERMAYARSHGLDQPAPTATTVEDQAARERILAEIRNPAARLAQARAWKMA